MEVPAAIPPFSNSPETLFSIESTRIVLNVFGINRMQLK